MDTEAVPNRFATTNSTRIRYSACHKKLDISKCCPCHKKNTVILRKWFKSIRRSHKKNFDMLSARGNVAECRACHTKPHWHDLTCNCHIAKIVQQYCACQTNRMSARHHTRQNVTKRSACYKTTRLILQNLQKWQLSPFAVSRQARTYL